MKYMKALTLHQPWASLIACGAKRIETRSWPPPRALIGKRIAIHAGRTMARPASFSHAETKALNSIFDSLHMDTEQGALFVDFVPGSGVLRLPRGAVLATAVLVAAQPTTAENRPPPDSDEALFGDFSPGRYGWELGDVRPLAEPYAVRGLQGLWYWEYEDAWLEEAK